MITELLYFIAAASSSSVSSGISTETWLTIAEGVTAAVAVVTLIYAFIQARQHRKEKNISDDRAQVASETRVSGEYLRRSLDAFDELVSSLQAEVGRMTQERNEARKVAEDIERKLSKEIDSLRRDIRSLRQVLAEHGIPIPAEIDLK